jgi:hypothetical protein
MQQKISMVREEEMVRVKDFLKIRTYKTGYEDFYVDMVHFTGEMGGKKGELVEVWLYRRHGGIKYEMFTVSLEQVKDFEMTMESMVANNLINVDYYGTYDKYVKAIEDSVNSEDENGGKNEES